MNILITGGTGSLGKELVKQLTPQCRKLVVYSRDELKQYEMRKTFPEGGEDGLRYFIGDVRDYGTLKRAVKGMDAVIHTAALKHVNTAEYNPTEAIRTNIEGSQNVVNACIDSGISKALLVSTDKAVNPVNLYGSTKLCAERLFIAANNLGSSRFAVCRYGNVINSRGSVLPHWRKLASEGKRLPITDYRMSRFWITIEQAAKFIIKRIQDLEGGCIYVPKTLKKAYMRNLATEISSSIIETGIRPGEKIHESLVNEEEARNCYETKEAFIIQPSFHEWTKDFNHNGKKLGEDFRLCSSL